MSIYDEIEEKRKIALNRWKSPIMKEALEQIIKAIQEDKPWLPILANTPNYFHDGKDLSGAPLKEIILQNKKITDTTFDFVDAQKSDFENSCFEKCTFMWSDFKDSNLQKSNLVNAFFSSSKLNGTNFSEAQLQNVVFSGADLTAANFTNADLTGAVFIGAKLKGTIFEGADLTNAKFGEFGKT